MYHFNQVGSIAEVHHLWLQLVDCCLRPRCSLQGRKRLGRRGRIVPRTFREGLVQNAKCTRRATRHRHRLAGKRAALDVDACCWCGRRCTTQHCRDAHCKKAGDALCLQSGSYGDAEQCRDADANIAEAQERRSLHWFNAFCNIMQWTIIQINEHWCKSAIYWTLAGREQEVHWASCCTLTAPTSHSGPRGPAIIATDIN